MSISSQPILGSTGPSLSRLPFLGRPRLLVSVRNAAEASLALLAGVDILDVKEPSQGSLGLASPEILAEISGTALSHSTTIPLSAALGELSDHAEHYPTLPRPFTYAKVGLQGCAGQPDWEERWCRFREQVDARGQQPLNWVAVSYVDAQSAAAPHPEEILEQALQTNCSAFLMDTWSKQGCRFQNAMSLTRLQQIAQTCRQHQLPLAVAGRLQFSDLDWLPLDQIDIVAIRSAVCDGETRTNPINVSKIQQWRDALAKSTSSS